MGYPTYIDESGVLTEGEAWVDLTSQKLSGNSASVSFENQTGDSGDGAGYESDWSQYVDLFFVLSVRNERASTGGDWLEVKFNDNAASGGLYKAQHLRADGSGISGTSGYTGGEIAWSPSTNCRANVFSADTFRIFDINSGKHKSAICMSASEFAASNGQARIHALTWLKPEPITKVTFFCTRGDLMTGSRLDMFGCLPKMVQ
jgi:hypothetical protein